MHMWPSRYLTDRNTPSRLIIDLGQSGYNGFLSIMDKRILGVFNVFDMFEDEIGLAALIIRCADFGILMGTLK